VILLVTILKTRYRILSPCFNAVLENLKDHDLKSEGFDLLGLIGAE
jgi:hypothetical protein